MKYLKACSLLLLVFCLTGCSVHPVQQEVTRIDNLSLVKHIRCETRQAIIEEAARLLASERKKADRLNEQRISVVYQKFLENPAAFTEQVARTELNKKEYEVYKKYIETGVALEFSLDITETNDIAVGVDPLGIFSRGIVKIGITASDKRMRQNTRTFIVSDTFRKLLAYQEGCKNVSLTPDLRYPISGRIGMGELITTFIDLNQGAPIVDSTKEIVDIKNNSPVFADTLRFTTTLSGEINPVVTLGPAAPASRGLRLLDANMDASASRQDTHQVIIALSLQPDQNVRQTRNAVVVGPLGAVSNKTVFAKRSIDPGSAEERAIEAITQQRLNNFYDRLVLPTP